MTSNLCAIAGLGVSVISLLASCAGTTQPTNEAKNPPNAAANDVPTTSSPGAGGIDVFPWSSEELFDHPKCREADAHMRSGAALLADFAGIRECLYWKAGEDEVKGAEIDRKMRNFYRGANLNGEGHVTRFQQFDEKQLTDLQTTQPSLPKEFFEQAFTVLQLRDDSATDSNADAPQAPPTVTVYLAPQYRSRGKEGPAPSLDWLQRDRHSAKKHREITKEALNLVVQKPSNTKVFSNDAVDLMVDASVDIDSYCWTHMPPHAQSAVTSGKIAATTEAEQAWAQFVMYYVRRAGQQCKSSDPNATRDALYQLGFVLHAVEDLSAHQGRTNEEHAYRTFVKLDSPDDINGAKALGVDITKLFLERAIASDLKECIPKFSSYVGKPVPDGEKGKILGNGLSGELNGKRDGNAITYIEYFFSFADYAALKKNNKVTDIRWLTAGALPTTCDKPPCSSLLDMVFQSQPISNPKTVDHCLRKSP